MERDKRKIQGLEIDGLVKKKTKTESKYFEVLNTSKLSTSIIGNPACLYKQMIISHNLTGAYLGHVGQAIMAR